MVGRGGNRTHNPRLRRPVLYPIELLARDSFIVAATAARKTSPHAARAACVSTPQPAAYRVMPNPSLAASDGRSHHKIDSSMQDRRGAQSVGRPSHPGFVLFERVEHGSDPVQSHRSNSRTLRKKVGRSTAKLIRIDLGGGQRPDIAFAGEDGRIRRVERDECIAQDGSAAVSGIESTAPTSLRRSTNLAQSASIIGRRAPISTAQSASTSAPRTVGCCHPARGLQEKSQKSRLRPATIVPGRRCGGDEGTVSTVLRLNERHPRVRHQGVARLGQKANEGIIRRVDDQCRHAQRHWHTSSWQRCSSNRRHRQTRRSAPRCPDRNPASSGCGPLEHRRRSSGTSRSAGAPAPAWSAGSGARRGDSAGRCSAADDAARSISGEMPTTAFSSRGGLALTSPAHRSTRLPPIE